jgi:hypothetical protein
VVVAEGAAVEAAAVGAAIPELLLVLTR